MRIWLDQVREEPFTWQETESIAASALDRPELLELGPVTWEGEVVYADPGYLLRGRLTYEQTLACIRCLAPHAADSSAEVELLVLVEKPHHGGQKSPPASQASADDEMELSDSDVSTLVVEDDALDTLPIVIEQLQLNIPMKPLCRESCRGLCPNCGADLNELEAGRCDCAAPVTDPRWAALASLKRDTD